MAAIAAFVLGGLSAFVSKAVSTSPNTPVAASGASTANM